MHSEIGVLRRMKAKARNVVSGRRYGIVREMEDYYGVQKITERYGSSNEGKR